MNFEDLLENLLATQRMFIAIGHKAPTLVSTEEFMTINRNLNRCIGALQQEKRGYLSPSESQAFGKHIKDLRDGRT